MSYFNPRSPCGERRPPATLPHTAKIFQSTLPVRGATRRTTNAKFGSKNFNPRSPCGERRTPQRFIRQPKRYFNPRSPCGERRAWCLTEFNNLVFISIHAPRAGSDTCTAPTFQRPFAFQSTLPVRGATTFMYRYLHCTGFQSTLPVRGATAAG